MSGEKGDTDDGYNGWGELMDDSDIDYDDMSLMEDDSGDDP